MAHATRPEIIPVSVVWRDLEYFYSPRGWMLVHRRVTPRIKFASTHLYTWVDWQAQCLCPGLEPGPLSALIVSLSDKTRVVLKSEFAASIPNFSFQLHVPYKPWIFLGFFSKVIESIFSLKAIWIVRSLRPRICLRTGNYNFINVWEDIKSLAENMWIQQK